MVSLGFFAIYSKKLLSNVKKNVKQCMRKTALNAHHIAKINVLLTTIQTQIRGCNHGFKYYYTYSSYPVNAIKVYYYGDPGMYKTTLGMTADKPLVIDADQGAYRTGGNRRGDVVVAKTWLDISNITEEDLAPYNTVVFDTIGRVLDLIKTHLANNSKNTNNKNFRDRILYTENGVIE